MDCQCATCRMDRGEIKVAPAEVDVTPTGAQRHQVLVIARKIADDWNEGVSINALHCAVLEAQESGLLPKGRVDVVEHFCTVTGGA